MQVSIEVFQALSKKNFGQRWLSPLEQIVPYAYGGVGRYVGFTPVWERTICGFLAGVAWGALMVLTSHGLGMIPDVLLSGARSRDHVT